MAGAGAAGSGDRIDAFVRATFGLRGTLGLHARALGWDLLRAPANVALAPLHLAVRGMAALTRRTGPRGLARRLAGRHLILRTGVAREVERRLASDLFGFASGPADRRPLEEQVATSPALAGCPPAEAALRAARVAALLRAYSGTRSAVAEITTAVLALGAGALLFRSLTPGMVSMAPSVAQAVTLDRAIREFPLGQGLGSLWYGAFPVGTPPALVAATVVALVVAAAAVTAFAGVIADPVQARLGIHRRRLRRLSAAVGAALSGAAEPRFAAHEHLLARFADLADLGAGLLRLFR